MSKTTDFIVNEDVVNNSSIDYNLQVVDMEYILDNMNLTPEDRELTKDIILNLEAQEAEAISKGLITQLPNYGTIVIDNIKRELHKHNKEMILARKQMTKDEYKQYVKDLRKDIKNNITEKRIKNIKRKKQQKNIKYFKKLIVNRGKAYVNMLYLAYDLLETIEFNQEVQDQYDKMLGRYEE